jgi:hypothetical protein
MKPIATTLLLVALASGAHAQSSLYGLTFDGRLITIDTTSGAGTLIGNTGLTSCDAMTADAAGRMFAISANDDLYRIDPVHACPTLVADVSQVEYVEELAFTPTGVLFGAGSVNADVGAERLIKIDPNTAQASGVGPFGAANDVDAMAYFPGDGMLYGSDLTLGRWLRIDPSTGAAADLGPQVNFLYALTFSPAGVLYGTAHTSGNGTPSTLVTLDRTSGTATVVGAVGFDSVAGLAFLSPPALCIGDVNADRVVNLADLSTLLAHFGMPTGATACQGDLNADGDVDLEDLATLLANFGLNCP